ncbi:GNAT family N-acetyltransferase [Candidatus Villigracilis saccharophilus]|uniref:GNAT family N-acetyltransferase n=1 Tax=Candidatus Villigracilis saccharophilus TaxID=3140684 RepID=UPI0031360BF3|nr:GNAT family N-acetyltransferase [Anaerolineales bacterium]
MIRITEIQANQVTEAKYVISAVAQRIFVPEKTVQEFYDILEEEGELSDVDNFQKVYVENCGLFLAVMDNDKLVGTGAVKKLDGKTAELKRLWLLEEYHGQKIGYQVVSRLLDFARAQKYERVWLQTSLKQERAISFYTRVGFYKIANYRESMDNYSMEIIL